MLYNKTLLQSEILNQITIKTSISNTIHEIETLAAEYEQKDALGIRKTIFFESSL